MRLLRGNSLHNLLTFNDADLIALAGDGPHCFAMLSDGRIVAFAPDGPTKTYVRPSKLTAAAAWRDSSIGFRLLRATAVAGRAVEAIGPDDPVVMSFAGAQAGTRIVAADATLVAAVSTDRQRITLWNAWNSEAPAGEIHVAAIARHRAADVLFVK